MFQLEYWLIYALISSLLYGLWGFYSKLATNYIDPKIALLYETIGLSFIILIFLSKEIFSFLTDIRGKLEAIGICLDKAIAIKSFSFNSDIREGLTILTRESLHFNSNIKGIIYAVLVGIIGGLASLFFLLALSKGHVSAVVPITALYPIFTLLMSYFFLKEPLNIQNIIGLILACVAIVLCAKA